MDENERTMGLGVIIHDSSGRFVEARTRKIQGTVDTMKAEALADREGLKLARDLGIRTTMLVGDAKIILESFDRDSTFLSHIGLILA